jgi:hypothetical protein
MPDSTLIDDACAALRGVADDVAAELDEGWRRAPLSAGVSGDPAARAALFAHATGGALDGAERAPGCPALRVRRGAITRFVVRGDEGERVETVPPEPDAVAVPDESAVAARQAALAAAEAEVPALVRVRPARWKVWLWPLRWLLAILARRRIAAWRRAREALEQARAEARRIADAAVRVPSGRARFEARLREVASAAGPREVAVEIAGDAMPDGVELIELTGWSQAGAAVDGVIELADGDAATAASTLAGLPWVLRDARAIRLARRAAQVLAAAAGRLDDELTAAEAGFEARLAQLETLRVRDPDRLIATQLAAIRPQVAAGISAAIEHASVHLGSELAGLAAGWNQAVGAATTSQELTAAATAIDSDAAASGQRIAGEVQMLAMGGLGGILHDVSPALLAPLAALGVTDKELKAIRAPLPPVAMLPSLTALGPSGLAAGRLASLFRSSAALKQELLDKLADRASRLTTKASAEMLEAEPALRGALDDALIATLRAALERQQARLDERLAAERAAIEEARATLAPTVQARDRLRAAERALAARIAALEEASPASARASSAH